MPMAINPRIVVLSCLHTRSYRPPLPKTGDTVFCPSCDKSVQVIKPPSQYRTKCRDCKRGTREYGDAFVTAETKAVAHATRHAGHKVTVWDGDTLVSTFEHETLEIDVPNF